MKTPYKIRHIKYLCHPETCNHDWHPSYKVTLGRNCLMEFETLKEARQWCRDTDRKYEVVRSRL